LPRIVEVEQLEQHLGDDAGEPVGLSTDPVEIEGANRDRNCSHARGVPQSLETVYDRNPCLRAGSMGLLGPGGRASNAAQVVAAGRRVSPQIA